MSFTVEDGTRPLGANSYSTVEAADAYHADRGNAAWALASLAQKQAALVSATDYVDRANNFIGWRSTQPQSLMWPRYDAWDEDGRLLLGVPTKVIQAVQEYALRALSAPLAPDPVYDSTGGLVTRKVEKVGPIEEETFFSERMPIEIRAYPMADALLRFLTRPLGEIHRG